MTATIRFNLPLRTRPHRAAMLGALLAGLCGGPAVADDRAGAEQVGKADQLREDLRRLIERARDRVFPSLVNIHVVTVDYWDGKEHKGRSVGSGTIISRDGHVVTNHHVTNEGRKFKCTLADRQEVSAKLVGEDPLTDLAVLKLELAELKSPPAELPVAPFGDSDLLQVGDYVMAMGSPLALSRSVTLGIVSNTERVFVGGSQDDVEEIELEEGQRTGLFTRWIQHDALIQPGNSGGPLVNLRGEIVGINELGGSSMGFAIPANLARDVVAALIRDGEVRRSWIGLAFKPIEKTGLDRGVLVNSIVKDGPAARAGIKAGDVIIGIDGRPVTVRFAEEIPPLMKRLADLPIGQSVRIEYLRDGKSHTAEVTTDKLQKDRGEETALRAWGLTVQEITEKMARDRRLDDTRGALVTCVGSGGPAALAEPALTNGDVVRAIDGAPVESLKELAAQYEKIMATEKLPEYLLVQFERGGKNHVTLLKPKPPEDEDPPREVAKAWIGVASQPVVDKLAKKLGLQDKLGFRVTRVYPGTLAAQSELRVGDVIIALEGQPLRPRGMQDAGLFAREVRRLNIDEPATLTILRPGEAGSGTWAEQQISVKLERTRITPEEARRDRNRDFELTVRELTFFDRDENRWDEDTRGVLVEQVEEAGWAGLGGLEPGDLIQTINAKEVRGLKTYRKIMEDTAKQQPPRVVFGVLRGAQTRFQYVEPEWKPVLERDAAGRRADRKE